MKPLLTMLLLLLLLPISPAAASTRTYKDGDAIREDTTWSGRVEVEGVVFVPEPVTLTIEPGTVVAFKKSGASFSEGDEGTASEVLIPGSGLRVEGKILAAGTRGARITFTSAETAPAPGDWGCIFLDHAKGSLFRYCNFSYSAYTLHGHFSRFDVSRSVITKNEDGSRLGMCRASFDHCDITENTGKGLNFRQSRVTVTYCNIKGNREGIFLNEKDEDCVIEDNNITGNTGMDLRLGEFHSGDVSLKGNYWGTTDPAELGRRIYDRADDPEVGAADIAPARAPVPGTGVDGVVAAVVWKFKTGGFVDSSAAVDGGAVYFGSWDRKLYAVRADNGEPIWSFEAGDPVDSSPAVSDGRVYFGSWDRYIYCLDAATGTVVWKYQMAPSNFDDHRQSSPVISEGILYMGGFNGSVYALRADDGGPVWEYGTGGPIRSRPAAEGGVVYVGSGDGALYALDAGGGGLLWTYRAEGPVNAGPLTVDGWVYFGSRDGRLYRLNAADGTPSWGFDTGSGVEYSSPLMSGNVIINANSGGLVHALDAATGRRVWAYAPFSVIYSSPQLADGMVVVADNCGGVHFLDAGSGSKLGVFQAGDAVQALSTGPDGVIYAGSRDGYMYALSAGR